MATEPTQPKRLLTVSDVAQWLSVSRSLVYQLVESGKLPVYRIGNGRGAVRFRPEDIDEYISSCRTEPTQPIEVPRKLRPHLKHLTMDK